MAHLGFVNLKRPLVQFIVVGAQKSGTTALDYALRQHEEIALPVAKELHFFDRDAWFFSLPSPLRAYIYHRKFTKSLYDRIYGEITPSYLYWQPAARRIYRYNPDIKLIAVLREPAARAYSHYAMEHARGREPIDTFEEAIRAEKALLGKRRKRHERVRSYLHRSLYAPQIKEFLRYFRERQILFLRFCDWRKRPGQVLLEISQFLGVSPFPNSRIPEVFSGKYPAMSPTTRARLANYFRRDINETERLTGLDLSPWRINGRNFN